MKNITITAHSGCEGTPDNSMESIWKGIELGADFVEIDIRMDQHGRMWLTHDEPENFTALVPLETALRTIKESGIDVNCDLKEESLLYPVLEAAEAIGIPREKLVFSGSVNVGLLKKDPDIIKRARIFLNIEQIFPFLSDDMPQSKEEAALFFDAHIDEIAELVRELGVECINPSFRLMPHERIEACHSRGIGLSLWTVNEEADQDRLLREDLVNITTRNPGSAMRLRAEIRRYGIYSE